MHKTEFKVIISAVALWHLKKGCAQVIMRVGRGRKNGDVLHWLARPCGRPRVNLIWGAYTEWLSLASSRLHGKSEYEVIFTPLAQQ